MGLIVSSSSSRDDDVRFFILHPDRFARIRPPRKEIVIDKQRGSHVVDECHQEFLSLGEHKRDRRRIILWRVPSDNVHYDPDKKPILKIPFLLFSDETVEDNDETLLPIIHELMIEQGVKQGLVGHG